MKKIILIIIFISITLALTFNKCRSKERFYNIDIKIQNIEAFGNNEDDDDNHANLPEGMYDIRQRWQSVFYAGLSLE